MTVPVPVCDVDVQFNIAFQDLFPIHPERGMNEIGARRAGTVGVSHI